MNSLLLNLFPHIQNGNNSRTSEVVLRITYENQVRVRGLRLPALGQAHRKCSIDIRYQVILGLPWWLRGYSVCLECGRPGFDPWVGKIPWRRKWHPTPVFLPGESHGGRSLVGYSPWGHKESDTIERLHFHQVILVLL